jgi:hypothetical protein
LTSFARGSSTPCECKIGFNRVTADGASHYNRCELDIEIPCIGAAPRCDTCRNDVGPWWSDCLSCGDGFFRQSDAASCLDYCPTGSIKDLITKECSNPGLAAISEVVFNKIGVLYHGLPFGVYNLEPGWNLGDLAPLNTIDRGLFFDGNTGHVKISGIILNTNFSVHFWIYFCEFTGEIIEVENETPTTDGEEQNLSCKCSGSTENADEADLGVDYNGGETTVESSGSLTLKQWVDLNLII